MFGELVRFGFAEDVGIVLIFERNFREWVRFLGVGIELGQV